MVLMDPAERGPLKYIHQFRKKIGGAESNVAIGLARLGHNAGWFSKLGEDPHGDFVESRVSGEGVDTQHVLRTRNAPTGLMFKERISGTDRRVYYYRHASAASELSPSDLPVDWIGAADYLHVTGITPLLSPSCRETTLSALEVAEEQETRTSFDPNIRDALWKGSASRETLLTCLERADVVIISQDEAELLFDLRHPEEVVEHLLNMKTDLVTVTLDEQGALADDGSSRERHPGFEVDVVDTVGAGDAFSAGFLSGLLNEFSLRRALFRANLCGAYATTVPGDMEGLPTAREVQDARTSNRLREKDE